MTLTSSRYWVTSYTLSCTTTHADSAVLWRFTSSQENILSSLVFCCFSSSFTHRWDSVPSADIAHEYLARFLMLGFVLSATFSAAGLDTSPIWYFFCSTLASGEWPTSSKASVASLPTEHEVSQPPAGRVCACV